MLYFIAVLDLVDEDFCGFKAGDVVLVNYNGSVAGNITSDFFLSFLVDETTETSNINIMAIGHISLNNIKEGFYRSGYIGLVDSSFFGYLVDYICFGHKGLLKGRKVNGQLFIRKMNLLIIMKMALRS